MRRLTLFLALLLLTAALAAQQKPIDRVSLEEEYRQRTGFEGEFWWFRHEDAVKQVQGPYMYEPLTDSLQARRVGQRIIDDALPLLNLGDSELRLHKVAYIPVFDQYNLFFRQYLDDIPVQPHGQLIAFVKQSNNMLTLNNSCVPRLGGHPVAELNPDEAFAVFTDNHPDVWLTSQLAVEDAKVNGTWQPRANPQLLERISPLHIEGSGLDRQIGDLRHTYILDLYGIPTIYFLDADTGEVLQEITRL